MRIILLFIIFIPKALADFKLEKIIHSDEVNISKFEEVNSEDQASTLSTEDIKNSYSSSLDDILRSSPDATTARGPRSSSEAPQVRGLDSNKIFVNIDGVRQNYREGHSSMIAVDTENLKKVEVSKTAGNFSSGSSIGGGVSFKTKEASDYLLKNKNIGSEFKYQTNSANFEKRYNAKSIFRKKKLSGIISLTSAKADDLYLNNGDRLDNSSFLDYMGLLKLNYQKFGVSLDYFKRTDNNPLDPSLNPPNSIQSLQADSTRIKSTVTVFREDKDSKLTAYKTDFETIKKDRESKISERRSIETVGTTFLKNKNKLLYGLDFYQDILSSDKNGEDLTSYPTAKSANLSGFIQKTFKLSSLSITPGAKYSYYQMESDGNDFDNKSANEFSKKLELSYQLNADHRFFGSYTEGFNAPRVNEVYPSGLHSPGDGWVVQDNYFKPNLKLKHETSQMTEVGYEFNKSFLSYKDLLKIKASIYENKVSDYIKIERVDRAYGEPEMGSSQFINLPDVNLYGGEISLGYLYDIYDFNISYTQVRGKDLTNSLYIEDLPADQYLYNFKVYLDRYQMNFGYLGIQALEQNRTNPETIQRTEKTPGYFIHNLFLNKTFDRNFEVGLRVDNLGNKKYRKHASHLYEAREDYKFILKYKVNTL